MLLRPLLYDSMPLLEKSKPAICLQGVYIFIFKTISCNFIANEENADDNDQNKQALLFPCKTYDFGALGDKTFLSYVFVRPGGNSKGPSSDSSNNLE